LTKITRNSSVDEIGERYRLYNLYCINLYSVFPLRSPNPIGELRLFDKL